MKATKKIFGIGFYEDFEIEQLGDRIAKWLKEQKLSPLSGVIVEIIDKENGV